MTVRALAWLSFAAVVALAMVAVPAHAQLPDPGQGQPPATGGPTPTPTAAPTPNGGPPAHVSAAVSHCGPSQATGAAAIETTVGAIAPPQTTGPTVPWTEFAVAGELRDPDDVVRALLEPAFKKFQTASEPDRTLGMAAAATTFGYQLVSIDDTTTATGVVAKIRLAPLPIVRHVEVRVKLTFADTLLDEEVRRRMQLKVGSYLPWADAARACKLLEERDRVEDYLHDDGYYDASAQIEELPDGDGTKIRVTIAIGSDYVADIAKIQIVPATGLDVPTAKIKAVFHHARTCLLGICGGTARFTRTQQQQDLQAVAELFHKAGYPAARVTSDYSPAGSFDRRSKKVSFKVFVEPRRKLFVDFDGMDDSVSNDDLRAQLTFDKEGAADDVEAQASAIALESYLQTRGHFDARVTWTRERLADTKAATGFDRIRFQIDLGRTRDVESVEFTGNQAIDRETLQKVVFTKANGLYGSLFGTNASATSVQLAADVERITNAYRAVGYRDTRVRVTAATDPDALDSAALTAALVSADHGDNLHVKFAIDEGARTELARVELAIDGDPTLCDSLLARLAEALGDRGLAQRDASAPGCAANAKALAFREDVALHSGEAVRDALWNRGRTRAVVDYHWDVLAPHKIVARYRVQRVEPLAMGMVVIRGNFATRDATILENLGFKAGKPLTADALAEGARLLRATGLFDSVNVQLPNLCSSPDPACVPTAGAVNAVVSVQERYDYLAQVDTSIGYSSYSGFFSTIAPSQKNVGGLGIAATAAFTYGTKIEAVEATLDFPRYLVRRIPVIGADVNAELTAFIRSQDTPNFGQVQTDGATAQLTRAFLQQPTPTQQARSITIGAHYDFRIRDRNVDALRPIGIAEDQTQVPVSTRTGSVGATLEWDQRVDRHGSLSPLAPDDGFRVNLSGSFASTWLGGQDDFVKISASGTRYWSVGDNLVLRADLRYDEGIPLFGAVLLPEVERFFAGGDSTVRGYNDDRMATEIVQVGVPPLSNVSQIRILPAGGNIRAMSSVDAQLRIYSVFATAVFSDAGVITNQWSSVTSYDIRPSVGMALVRIVTPFGLGAVEYAVPLDPHLGDDPRGRWHISFAARAQF